MAASMRILLTAVLGSLAAAQPASFDCGMRLLAYDFGRQLLPRHGRFEPLYYALDLNSPGCPGPAEEPGAAATPPGDASEGLPPGAVIVCASRGRAGAAGTVEEPLASLHEAALRVASGRRGTGARAVVLRGGVHYLDRALQLGPEHSGMSLRSYPGETAVVSGGRRVHPLWRPFNTSGGANVYVADLGGQVSDVPGLQLDGVRATRARFPNLPGGIEVSPGYGSMVSGSSAVWTPPDFDRFGKVEYHTDTSEAHLRNNTPDGWFQRYMVGVGGLCSVYDPPVGYWCSEHPSGGGAFAFRTPTGAAMKPGTLPHSPYADASQMMFHVWRPARWANWMFEVADYDTEAANFSFGHGGFQGARGENQGGDFFVENVFEELDNPGEFFFNRSTGMLYLFYNGTGAPPASMEVVIPTIRTLVNVSGTRWDPVKNVSIDGVVFKSTRYTYMDPHGVPSAGDWALDRISAVFLQGTENAKVSNSTFDRLDGNAVMISGYNRNATVEDCDFSYIGGNAIVSWGYTNETENTGFPYYTPNTNYPEAGVDGTDDNHPRYNHILRNLAREVGLYEKQSSFYMQAKTAQSTIYGNVFFNGPRAGINFNDGFGGGDQLSYNLVFSTCRESGDHGPFNSWDRQPYLTTVRTGEPSMLSAWRELHHNFFIDNYSPQENIDNDDGSAYYKSHHNFLVYGGNGMKNDFGGHDNHHYANVYAYVGQALGVDGTLFGHEDVFRENRVVLTSHNVGSPQCREPRTHMSSNQYFTPDGTALECSKSLSDAQLAGMDNASTVARIPPDSTILNWGRDLLGIKDSAARPGTIIV